MMCCILIWVVLQYVEIALNQILHRSCYQKDKKFSKSLKITIFHAGYEHRIVINSDTLQFAFSLSLSQLGTKKQGITPVL